MATRRLRRRFALTGCALALLIGVGWAAQELRVNQAEQGLATEKSESTRLSSQTHALAPVRGYVATVEKQKRTVQSTMANEVYFSRVLDGFRAAMPTGVNIQSASVTLAAPATTPGAGAPKGTPSPCPGPDPFHTRPVVGCIALSGSADNRGAVGKFVVSLGGSGLFVEPFISTTTTADEDSVMFVGSVGLSRSVFSKRYADLDRLFAQEEAR